MEDREEISPHVFRRSGGYEYAEWKFTIHCSSGSRDLAADLIQDAMEALQSRMMAEGVAGPAVQGSGIPGPKMQARIDAARRREEANAKGESEAL